MGTPSFMRRTPEEERALLEELAAMRPQQTAPAFEPPPAPDEPDALDQLAGMSRQAATQAPAATTASSYEAPPERSKDTWQKFLLMAMDLGLNKGRNLGTYIGSGDNVDYDNWMRRDKAKTSASMRDRVRGNTPEEMELERRRVAIAEGQLGYRGRGLDNSESAEARKQAAQDAKLKANTPEARRVADVLTRKGVPAASLTDAEGNILSVDEMRQISPLIKHEIDLAMSSELNAAAADKAGGIANATVPAKVDAAVKISDATMPNKLKLAEAQADLETSGKNPKVVQDQSAQFGQELRLRGVDRARAALDNVEGVLASMPEDLPGYGATGMAPMPMLSDEGKDLRRRVEELLDTKLRVATGAAAPPSEAKTFREILGVGTLSTDEDLRRAVRQVRELVQNQEGYVAEMYPNARQASRAQPGGLGVAPVGPKVNKHMGIKPPGAGAVTPASEWEF